MEESTLRWPTDKERDEMEEVCSIGELVRCRIPKRAVDMALSDSMSSYKHTTPRKPTDL